MGAGITGSLCNDGVEGIGMIMTRLMYVRMYVLMYFSN